MTLDYAAITPARNEAGNLPRLAGCLAAQTVKPSTWLVVDNGSTDKTSEVALMLANELTWLRVLDVDEHGVLERGGPIVRALQAGLDALAQKPEVIVSIDADVAVEPDYFERLLHEFANDETLGIASGSCYEQYGRDWRQRHVTGTTAWGAVRAYRWACLQEVLPLEARLGWDGIDEIKANARGWRTTTFVDLPFFHYRREGERDPGRVRARAAQGRSAWFMGYRPWYLALRAVFNARRDPAAVAMIWGYLAAAVRREERCSDLAARAYLRRQQSLRNVPLRLREARGDRSSSPARGRSSERARARSS